ncbi:sensor histidine kinase [Glacieibacterium frigidum]|uniref:Sensor histidine kinase n=1 Tax=Glacieibacterium frigidum TaxID=2593303 RepID=A0A552UFM1_9SPHN|nr:histidine kinase [Glacieibacterium frigidum]TRW17027.1 sensor histidine kinase [Glacieibacterium frigidum]
MADPEQPPTGRAPPRLAVLSILGFWAFYFSLNSMRAAMWDGPDQFDMLGRRAVVAVFGIMLTGILYLVLRQVEGRTTRTLVLTAILAAVPIALAYSAINYMAFYVVSPSENTLAELAKNPKKLDSPLHHIVDSAVSWYFFIVAWGVLWVAMANAARVRHAERQAARYQAEAQAAQLRALRYQINPHFLFNTLNSLSALVLAGRNADAERMIMTLSTFFRSSLTGDPVADVPLADEIAMQRLYLAIEAVRFPERLLIDIDVPDALADVRVPGLILQPVVENAIKHGVAPTQRPVTVSIRARAVGDWLEIVVEDDGAPAGTAAPSTGTGMRNVCERLAARFGERARCEAGPRLGGGYRVVLGVPMPTTLRWLPRPAAAHA